MTYPPRGSGQWRPADGSPTYGQPTYGQPTYGQSPFGEAPIGPPPGFGVPPGLPGPPRTPGGRGRTVAIVLAAVAGVLVVGLVGIVVVNALRAPQTQASPGTYSPVPPTYSALLSIPTSSTPVTTPPTTSTTPPRTTPPPTATPRTTQPPAPAQPQPQPARGLRRHGPQGRPRHSGTLRRVVRPGRRQKQHRALQHLERAGQHRGVRREVVQLQEFQLSSSNSTAPPMHGLFVGKLICLAVMHRQCGAIGGPSRTLVSHSTTGSSLLTG